MCPPSLDPSNGQMFASFRGALWPRNKRRRACWYYERYVSCGSGCMRCDLADQILRSSRRAAISVQGTGGVAWLQEMRTTPAASSFGSRIAVST